MEDVVEFLESGEVFVHFVEGELGYAREVLEERCCEFVGEFSPRDGDGGFGGVSGAMVGGFAFPDFRYIAEAVVSIYGFGEPLAWCFGSDGWLGW